MTSKAKAASLAALALVGLLACDLGPRGPSQVAVAVRGDPTLGAAVLDVTWPGVQGVDGLGSTQAYSAAVPSSEDRHRVILVDAEGGELRFSVLVEDPRADAPSFAIVAAADTTDLPLPVAVLRVVLEP